MGEQITSKKLPQVARLSEAKDTNADGSESRATLKLLLWYLERMNIEWNFFDREADSLASNRNMPHIDMLGHLTFVTFRLADSMPREVVETWHHEIESWLKEHNLSGRTVEDVQ